VELAPMLSQQPLTPLEELLQARVSTKEWHDRHWPQESSQREIGRREPLTDEIAARSQPARREQQALLQLLVDAVLTIEMEAEPLSQHARDDRAREPRLEAARPPRSRDARNEELCEIAWMLQRQLRIREAPRGEPDFRIEPRQPSRHLIAQGPRLGIQRRRRILALEIRQDVRRLDDDITRRLVVNRRHRVQLLPAVETRLAIEVLHLPL